MVKRKSLVWFIWGFSHHTTPSSLSQTKTTKKKKKKKNGETYSRFDMEKPSLLQRSSRT
ncbi:hypothetical protein Hanom_Chr05g00463351 [Helianthus anomalus]